MYTAFVCLGGTGTQLGTAVGNLYPLLRLSRIAEAPFSMFILDKDTNSGIYKACTGALQRYSDSRNLLPFEVLPSYELSPTVYQDMQESTGLLRNKDYTVMNLIGDDAAMKELAAMCWTEEKRNESLRDGNNRDPSRGSLDALVCLEHLTESSLFQGTSGKQGLQNLVDKYGEQDVRVVILGGATGGMGSSLIVPLAERLREKYSGLRIDMVLLGTYFEIPQRNAPPPGATDIDNIGTSLDSFYRAADQVEELYKAKVVDNNWRVYYTAMPGFDNTAGKFDKNGAVKRKTHLLELAAALAAFEIGKQDPGYYGTSLDYGENKKTVDWTDIPRGNDLKKPTADFLKILSVLVCGIYPALCADAKDIRKNGYLKQYFKKNPADEIELITNMRDDLKVWLQNITPYFEFWQEIQLNTRLGAKNDKPVVNFFDQTDMNRLTGFLDLSQCASENEKLPFWGDKTWLQFVDDIKPDKKRLVDATDAAKKLKWMFEDIWNIIYHKEG
jgi:hypothetical protein